jgi:polyhydroxyalkanoate synthesis regulator phasin
MLDAMRGYLHAAGGLTELTRKRAQELAQSLIAASGSSSTGAVAAQVSSVAEELVNAAKSNRTAVREMVRGEVEVAVARLGLVPATELAKAHRKIAKLEATVAELAREGGRRRAAPGSAGTGPGRATGATAQRSRPKRSAVKQAAQQAAPKTASKSATATQAPTKRATAKKAATKTTVAKKAATKTTVAKKAATKKTPVAKKAAAKKATAKRASTRRAPGTSAGAATGS